MTEEKKYKYLILTFGCQMNKSDSERLAFVLENMGMEKTEDERDADVIILNTCSVRESAEARIYGKTFNLSKLKKIKPDLIVGVTGCMAGRDKDGEIKKRLKEVDLFFPTKDMTRLPAKLLELNPNLRPMNNTEEDYLKLRPNYQKAHQAFIVIQTGCNQFCSYCVVPYARGLKTDRPVKDILDEINNVVKKGCLEITLLGQIVNHYTAPDPENFSVGNPYKKNDFAKLLWEINQIDGVKRLDWPAPHPLYFDEELLDALTLPKQLNYVHLPVQSGNNEILQKMNRRHTREYYIGLVKKIREKRPEIAIGTDIIVGFCGETEEQFQDTVDLYKQCQFDISYHARYSPRSGTVAEKMFEDTVSREEKRRRWQVLQDMMEEITREKNKKYLDKTLSVLVDDFTNGWCVGNSQEMKRVTFEPVLSEQGEPNGGGENLVGTIQNVKIFKTDNWMMWGHII
ncbi:MAG: tRNA (N6-isopentenyl adenosine(37)-C2)-methylthiotransferase MiaB [Candidatus Magasanikbacteria bacterium RIFOXYC2_FULL_40_16]|uniref:tRNA-2-methylthio-N(6)-dimethylallyladenosine synthase n=1 Tax=Candidatus Magasanikbacteria bacterium RIFOXYC2_FULL_40_16 TaxID=1798703 RepID=A0A1F6P167_9BACT|nr:MAG: tRNA (N6-isopentenyl adenosine(37)-C2)-methylthiotransferase MiaB [Candidatus Magasanikbacteria bacterium RIFOXYA2_FULL_40_20]OGH85084.1 MAG: tRNA (N6-isopentenyl adenosine(37)-C2)-methylthiotransferase MiaB [Candidatus Magasanikbacteria bacterium RIFOXYB2_FULL_40_13]OGH89909.1 MAG: tRNA (N6-isopentenyl adenosine(37)-C2)-methylthiotransferase MiaB [Candidatus Magasanikbacteria bacterium RIFOXYC2_FULL_40_16]